MFLCVSVCLCLCRRCLSVCLCASLSQTSSVWAFFVPLFIFRVPVSLCVSICVCVWFSVCLYLSACVSWICLLECVFVPPCVSGCVSLLCLCWCICVCLSVSLCVHVCWRWFKNVSMDCSGITLYGSISIYVCNRTSGKACQRKNTWLQQQIFTCKQMHINVHRYILLTYFFLANRE